MDIVSEYLNDYSITLITYTHSLFCIRDCVHDTRLAGNFTEKGFQRFTRNMNCRSRSVNWMDFNMSVP